MPDISLKCSDNGFTKSTVFECEIFSSLLASTNLSWLGEPPEHVWGSPSGRRAYVEVRVKAVALSSDADPCSSGARLGDVAGEFPTPPASHSPLQIGMISPTSWDCEGTSWSTVEIQHGIIDAQITIFSRIPNSRCVWCSLSGWENCVSQVICQSTVPAISF